MATFNFGGYEEENVELKRMSTEVLDDPDNYELWEKLLRTVESIEGGLNRNSSPQVIAAAREIYNRFLQKFPLFFGYWKKYADNEFSIAGTEAAEMIYERGVASITSSVDLWAQYCTFKTETSHDPDVIRELFERGANHVGLDFLAHPFWDKYLDFEERAEGWDKIFTILGRIIHIPMHQYARYFERFRQLATSRPLTELAPAEMVAQFRAEIEMANGDMDSELRARIDEYHMQVFHTCQAETSKRWQFEQEIKRPYFHVTELDEAQITNWHKYLEFEIASGNYQRTAFLFERCLVTAAYYEEFWLQYVRWMHDQMGKTEEVRNIYQRASCIYVPIARPSIRLDYARFEESQKRVDVAYAIYEAILMSLPGNVNTITAWANCARRHDGIDAAIAVYQSQIDSGTCTPAAKSALYPAWANLLLHGKKSVGEAREVFQANRQSHAESRIFWEAFLKFEVAQPTTGATDDEQHVRIRKVFDEMRFKAALDSDTIKEIGGIYLDYLDERGPGPVAEEYLQLERQLDG